MCSSDLLAGEFDVVLIARANGVMAADIRPLVRVSITVIAEQNGRREVGSSGGGGRFDYHFFDSGKIDAWIDEAVRSALVNLESRPAPAGAMTVVLGPGWPGVLLHEAVGHGLEGDFNRKGTSAFSELMGKRVAAKGVTVVDDGTINAPVYRVVGGPVGAAIAKLSGHALTAHFDAADLTQIDDASPRFDRSVSAGTSATADWRSGLGHVVAIASYRMSDFRRSYDVDNSPADLVRDPRDGEQIGRAHV